MGNVLSLDEEARHEPRVHICEHGCGYWTTNKTDLRHHKSRGCDGGDRRCRRPIPVIPVQPAAHLNAASSHPASTTCEHDQRHCEHTSQDATDTSQSQQQDDRPSDDVAELRLRLTAQLFEYLDHEGLDADADAVSGLAGLVAGILENDLDEQLASAGVDDTLEELREMLGVDMYPSSHRDTEDSSDGQDPATVHELQRLLAHLHDPVEPGSQFSTLQMAIIQLAEKRAFRIPDEYFDRQCLLNHKSRPDGNFYPRSYYLMKKVAGVKDTRDMQVHMCVNDCQRFSQIKAHEYRQNVHNRCDHCGELRFEVKMTASGTRIIPRKVMYWFGVGNVIHDQMFTDPGFTKHRGTGRSQYYYPTPEADRLHTAAGCSITDPDISAYEVGLDWAQMFHSKVHSSGFIMLRCADMPLGHLNRRCHSYIVGIIPGPNEPKHIDPYLEPLLEEFRAYGPKGAGLEVVEHKYPAGSSDIQLRRFKHTVLLSGIFGDSPAIKKLSHWLSHAAYLGCGYCLLRGTRGEGGGMYFTGYFGKTSYGAFAPDEVKHYGAHSDYAVGTAMSGDPETKLSSSAQKARATVVDQKLAQPNEVGCHGWSAIVKELPYSDYNNIFVVPIAHAGLCGVVKDFWCHVLSSPRKGQAAPFYVLSNEAKRVISGRQADMVPTCDFGRRYSDIITKKGNWTMEDWLHWTETWSMYVLAPHGGQPLLHPTVQKMWNELRSGLLYFCRSHPTPGVAQSAIDASAHLKRYGRMVEQHFGVTMCKFNLHLLVCRLVDQEAARGKVSHSTEYWVENLIQWAKST